MKLRLPRSPSLTSLWLNPAGHCKGLVTKCWRRGETEVGLVMGSLNGSPWVDDLFSYFFLSLELNMFHVSRMEVSKRPASAS